MHEGWFRSELGKQVDATTEALPHQMTVILRRVSPRSNIMGATRPAWYLTV
ncbi:hypothetical protein [Acinetobacter sp. ANC 4177]|uniref:hypothetical protein n=1 Tax=Acinetobacter sp. ANC 4177 TaxID=2529838 RepID=UPI001BC8801B|nr:hypothetical protein [Acinetobacter sp. ANC 4177]